MSDDFILTRVCCGNRIADIVAVLKALDDDTLETVRKMILPLKEKGESATAG